MDTRAASVGGTRIQRYGVAVLLGVKVGDAVIVGVLERLADTVLDKVKLAVEDGVCVRVELPVRDDESDTDSVGVVVRSEEPEFVGVRVMLGVTVLFADTVAVTEGVTVGSAMHQLQPAATASAVPKVPFAPDITVMLRRCRPLLGRIYLMVTHPSLCPRAVTRVTLKMTVGLAPPTMPEVM